jgi:hypothetical protein
MYRSMRWEDSDHVLQYIIVGKHTNPDLGEEYKGLVQITWQQVGQFLYKRFKEFPEKMKRGQLIPNPVVQ